MPSASEFSPSIRHWKYKVSEIRLIIPKETPIEIREDKLVEMSILHDYEENAFPLFKITMILEGDLYHKFVQYKDSAYVKLRIDKYYEIQGESKALSNDTKSTTYKFINTKFNYIMEEDTDNLYLGRDEDEANDDYTTLTKKSEEDLEKIDNRYTFYLFKTTTVRATKKMFNGIFTGVNVSDMITYIASLAKINNIYMAKVDNKKTYKQFLVPPLSTLKALEFINDYYGIYKTGTMIYFGFSKTYIIPFNGRCVSYKGDEIRNIMLIVPKSDVYGKTFIPGQAMIEKSTGKKSKADKYRYYFVDFTAIRIENQSTSSNLIDGTNIKTVDPYTGVVRSSSVETSDKEKDNISTNVQKIEKNTTLNKFYESTYTAKSRALKKVITLRIDDCNIIDFEPNKHFTFNFLDSKYTKKNQGDYIISKIHHVFTKEGEDFSVYSEAVFKREKNPNAKNKKTTKKTTTTSNVTGKGGKPKGTKK